MPSPRNPGNVSGRHLTDACEPGPRDFKPDRIRSILHDRASVVPAGIAAVRSSLPVNFVSSSIRDR